MVGFFEEDKYLDIFSNLRSHLRANLTKTYKVSKEKLWAFSLKPKIQKIFSSPGYPKHNPNTVIVDYSCIMHAKYEFMLNVSQENPFHTKYIAWIDIGIFRDIVASKDGKLFKLKIPPNFEKSQIAYSEIKPAKSPSISNIFRHNLVTVCGGFFIGRPSVMQKWSHQYKYYVEKYLNIGVANTDQQVLYAMLVDKERPAINIQTYTGDGKSNKWFYLPYLCKKQGEKEIKS